MGKVTSISVFEDRNLPAEQRMTEEDAARQRGIAGWKRANKKAMDERDEEKRAARAKKKTP